MYSPNKHMLFLHSFVLSPPEDVDDEANHENGVNDEPESEKIGPVGGSDHLGYEVFVVTELANWRTGVQLSVTKTGQALQSGKGHNMLYIFIRSVLIPHNHWVQNMCGKCSNN